MNFFISTLLLLQLVKADNSILFTDGCGSSKGCLYKPDDCDPLVDCIYFGSYSMNTPDTITFELLGKLLNTSKAENIGQWVAIGMSDDNEMGDDAVTYCTFLKNNPMPRVGLAYNPPEAPTRMITNASDTMFKFGTSTVGNTYYYCKFEQRVIPNVRDSRIRPLNGTYYLLMASGLISSSKPSNEEVWQMHSMDSNLSPLVSKDKINMADKDYGDKSIYDNVDGGHQVQQQSNGTSTTTAMKTSTKADITTSMKMPNSNDTKTAAATTVASANVPNNQTIITTTKAQVAATTKSGNNGAGIADLHIFATVAINIVAAFALFLM